MAKRSAAQLNAPHAEDGSPKKKGRANPPTQEPEAEVTHSDSAGNGPAANRSATLSSATSNENSEPAESLIELTATSKEIEKARVPTAADESADREDDDESSGSNPDAIISPSDAEYPPDLLKRVMTAINMADPGHNIFALSKVPPSVTWGTGTEDHLLCVDGKPVTTWIVGEIDGSWFFDRNGEPLKNVSVSVRTVRVGDGAEAKAFLSGLATVPNNITKIKNLVYTGRLQTKRVRGQSARQPCAFTNAWDARECFDEKRLMFKLSPNFFDINDLVLIEALVTRYRCDIKGHISYKGPWTTWRTSFELQHLSLLATGNDNVVANEAEAEDETWATVAF